MKPTSKSEENKIDLATVNKSKKQLKLPEIKNPLTKQKGPKRDDEGKFTAGSGGLRRLNSFNLKRAIPLFVIISLVGGSMVYQSFAAACSITADKTSLYEGESTTIRWKSPSVPVVIDGGNMGSVKDGQWGSGALYATKTFKLVGGWDSSCTDSVTVTVSKKPATNPANPTTPAPTNPVTTPSPTTPGTSSLLKDAQAWTTLGAAHVAGAKKENEATYKISLKSSVTRAELDSIGAKEKHFRDSLAQMQSGKSTVQGLYNKAISSAATKSQGPAILAEVDKIQGHISSLSGYIQNIANDYQRARVVYEKTQQAPSPAGTVKQVVGSSAGAVQETRALAGLQAALQTAKDAQARALAQAALNSARAVIEQRRVDCERYSRTITIPINGKDITTVFKGKFNSSTGVCSEYQASEKWVCRSGYVMNSKKNGCLKSPTDAVISAGNAAIGLARAAVKAECLSRRDEIVQVKKRIKIGPLSTVISVPAHSHRDWYWSYPDNKCRLSETGPVHLGSTHRL